MISSEFLTVASLVATGLVVVVLVLYLSATLLALRRAGNHLEALVAELDRTAAHTGPLEGNVETINGALGKLLDGLSAIDKQLAGIANVFRR